MGLHALVTGWSSMIEGHARGTHTGPALSREHAEPVCTLAYFLGNVTWMMPTGYRSRAEMYSRSRSGSTETPYTLSP